MRGFASVVLSTVIAIALLLASASIARAANLSGPHTIPLRRLSDKGFPKLRLRKNERVELKRILDSFIDEMFREAKLAEAIKRHLRLAPLSAAEAKAVDKIRGRGTFSSREWAEFLSAYNDAETISRAFAILREYEMDLATLLWVGTVPLEKSEYCVHFYQSDGAVEGEQERILASQGMSEDEFYTLLGRKSPDDVKMLKAVSTKLISFIKGKSDKRILEVNLALMKSKQKVAKLRAGHLIVYAAFFEPIYQAIFVREGGRMRMIAFGDIADSC